jgi:lysozyme
MKFKILVDTYVKADKSPASNLDKANKIFLKAGTVFSADANPYTTEGYYNVSFILKGTLYKDWQLFDLHVEEIKYISLKVVSRRTINEAGRNLIKEFESLRLVSYPDPGTGARPYTIGWGHTGVDVPHSGIKITKEQAEKYLSKDLVRFEKSVMNLIHVELTDNEFAALVSFAYNVGEGNLSKSSACKLINKNLKEKGFKSLISWNKAAGKVLNGLTRRREAEINLAGYSV